MSNMFDERHPLIKPRRVTFDWSGVPLHFIPGSPFATHWVNALQLILPAGERWFVHVFKQALPLIEDKTLHAEAKGFMGQEAVHARAHSAVYTYLKSHGIDASREQRRIDFIFRALLSDRPVVPLRWIPARRWLHFRLGVIAGVEHYTAVMGDWLMNADALDRADADPVILDLFRWHGAEEVEHRSVAFDVYQHLNGNYPRRVLTMLIAFAALWFTFHRGTSQLLRHDPVLRTRAARDNTVVRFSYRTWTKTARQGLLPSPWFLARELPTYLSRSYHPSQTGSTPQALAYL
ncbi:MAG: metal-dependent hydrolase, partial [Streptosporangiaceae bacterium]